MGVHWVYHGPKVLVQKLHLEMLEHEEPEHEEDEDAEEEEVVDVVVAVRLQQLPDLADGVGDDGARVVKAVVNFPYKLLLFLELIADVDGEVLELVHLATELALHLLVGVLQGLVAQEVALRGALGVGARPAVRHLLKKVNQA